MENIGILLKQFRERKNLSQECVADSLRVSSSTISRIESGKTNVAYSAVLKYCEFLQVKLSDLLAPNAAANPKGISINNINLNVEVKSASDLEAYLSVLCKYECVHKINT